jgi:L-seryl-tRNA(Ser) seleniumtransferase
VNSSNSNPLSKIPGVDVLLNSEQGVQLIKKFGHSQFVDFLRHHLAELRVQVRADPTLPIPATEDLLSQLEIAISEQNADSLKPVINLTGTIIHTNLGRSQLPQTAIAQIVKVSESSSNLEFDLSTGKRGDRDSHTEKLLADLTGAEAATVVNNNAAAVLLVLNTLAKGKEVPVSRGELVEIGGSFRIPDIMSGSGCTLVEIGTTNRTHLKDYQEAIHPETAMLMKVHTSNYEIQGFTKSVDEAALAQLAKQNNIPFVTDLGSGTLVDFTQFGLPPEPTVQEAISSGANIVTFSGDKLLGGPQAGIIVGDRELISRIKANPLKRALRVDKMTIAALFEVLKLYRQPETLRSTLPTLRHLSRPENDIKQMAENLLPLVQQKLKSIAEVNILSCESQIGSGALPTARIASWGIEILPKRKNETVSSERALQNLIIGFRNLPKPMIGRVQGGALFFDLRTLDNIEIVSNQLVDLNL